MVRAFAHGAMGRRIDPSWGGPIELFLVPASVPRLVIKGCDTYYPVCGMMHIKEPLLLIGKPMWWQWVSSLAIRVVLNRK